MRVDEDFQLTGAIIGAAMAVHRELGPGLDEIIYEESLSAKLSESGIEHSCQLPLPLCYKGMPLDAGYRLDILVARRLPLELKSVETILPIHEAQLLTYLRLSQLPLGLLVNFDVVLLKEGIRRRVLTTSACRRRAARLETSPISNPLSHALLDAAFEVHRHLGPGLIRSVYETCLCHELQLRGIDFQCPHFLRITPVGNRPHRTAEIPLLVDGSLPVFCLSVAGLTKLHESRLLARMRQGCWPHGFLFNFNAPTLVQGIRRLSLK